MNWSARSSSIAPSGMTSMKVRSKPRPCAQSTSARASASLKPLSATALILTLSPAATAASMPFMTLSWSPQRVTARNLSGSSVSSETLIRRTPQSASSCGESGELRAVGRQRHLVERAALEMAPEAAEERHHVAPDQRLAAGDAKLAGPEPDEGRTQPVEFLERQNVPLGQEIHVLGHAIDAAEVAAVRHRHAHIGDAAAERVDEGRFRRGG